MNVHACPKCQSAEIIPDVRVIDHAHLNQPMELSATIYTNPAAWVFEGPISHRFRARVCGSCGYTEFYVEDPHGLLEWSRKGAPKS